MPPAIATNARTPQSVLALIHIVMESLVIFVCVSYKSQRKVAGDDKDSYGLDHLGRALVERRFRVKRKEVLFAVIGGVVIVWLMTTLYSMNQKIESMEWTLHVIQSTVGGSTRQSSVYSRRDTVMEKLDENYYLLNDIESRLRGE